MSDTSKLIVAFFLGLAVALGSIAVYMRQQQPAPAVAMAAPAPQPMAALSQPIVPPVAAPVASEPEPVRRAATPPIRKAKPRLEEQAEKTSVASPAKSATQLASNLQSAPGPAPAAPAASPFAPPPPPAFTPSPAPPAAAAQPHTISLALGTVLNVRLNQNLTSEKNASGDTFLAILTAPVIVDGFVIADRGSKVQGQVVEADRSGRVKGRASMTLALSEINTTDGQRIRVQTDSVNKEAASGKTGDAAKMAGGAALGALIGGLAGGGKGAAIGAGAGGAAGTGVVLGTRGKEVNLPTETALTFHLTSPVTITEQIH